MIYLSKDNHQPFDEVETALLHELDLGWVNKHCHEI